MNRYVSILEELEKCDLCSVTDGHERGHIHLNLGFTVVQDSLLDSGQGIWAKLAIEKSVFPGILNSLLLAKEFSHLHLVLGDGPRLAAANLVNSSHLLWGIELAHQNFVVEHSHDCESKGDSDCKWQSFRYRDNENNNDEGYFLGQLAEEGSSNSNLVLIT